MADTYLFGAVPVQTVLVEPGGNLLLGRRDLGANLALDEFGEPDLILDVASILLLRHPPLLQQPGEHLLAHPVVLPDVENRGIDLGWRDLDAGLAGALRLDADQDQLVEDGRKHLPAKTFLLGGGGGAQLFLEGEAAGLLQFEQGDDFTVDDGGNPVDHHGRGWTGSQYQGRGERDSGAGGRKGAADRSHAGTCIRHSVPPGKSADGGSRWSIETAPNGQAAQNGPDARRASPEE